MAKKKSDDDNPLTIIKLLLNSKFEQAKAEGKQLWPDDAMREVFEFFNRREANKRVDRTSLNSDVQPQFNRINDSALAHNAHRYAVDLFYKFYAQTKQGAPRIPDADLAYILRLNESGKSPSTPSVWFWWLAL